jgi:citryl-CoA synthetase large subunit
MNLYEFEGKNIFEKYGIKIPRGIVVRRGENFGAAYTNLGVADVVVKAQVLSGKRGKGGGIKFCSSAEEVQKACEEIFAMNLRGQYIAAIRIEEKLAIAEEQYLSITYDTNKKQPVLIYSRDGGMDIEDVSEEKITKQWLDIREGNIESEIPFAKELWQVFLKEDTRLVEINPLVKTVTGDWIAADAKIAIDDDAFYRHSAEKMRGVVDWETFEPRTMMGRLPTEREIEAKKIDEGEAYYRGTAGKYIEMEGDIALILNGGGASIANMDAIIAEGLKPANYTEYSGNPPREKVQALAKVVLSKPGVRGLWMCGVVANFTNMKETFLGIIDVLDELKPSYPIVVRRDGPESIEAIRLVEECAARNNLNLKIFNKDMGMSESAKIFADMLSHN